MAEALAVAASVIAVIQLAERVAIACRFYISGVDDYPKDLRLIYVEVASLKVILEGLSFLDEYDDKEAAVLRALLGDGGPIQGCKKALEELAALVPSPPAPSTSPSATSSAADPKKDKSKATKDGLAKLWGGHHFSLRPKKSDNQAVAGSPQPSPASPSPASGSAQPKKGRLKMAMAGLAWPRHASVAKKLLDEIMHYKVTISVALQEQLL